MAESLCCYKSDQCNLLHCLLILPKNLVPSLCIAVVQERLPTLGYFFSPETNPQCSLLLLAFLYLFLYTHIHIHIHNLIFFPRSPFVCCVRIAVCSSTCNQWGRTSICRVQRAAVFLGAILNSDAGGSVKPLATGLSWALPTSLSLSKYAWLVLTVNRSSEPEHKQSGERKLVCRLHTWLVSWVWAICWCSLGWWLRRRIRSGQQVVVILRLLCWL